MYYKVVDWTGRPWKIGFREQRLLILDGDGDRVEFQNSKIDELFLVLSLYEGKSLMRDAVSACLWPDSSIADQRNNFRQILFQLRSRLGKENLHADRTTCSLSERISVVIEPGVPTQAYLGLELSSPATHVIQDFTATLRWLLENNPHQMLDMMRVSKDLTTGIAPWEMAQLMNRVSRKIPFNHPSKGWEYFWRSSLVHGAGERRQMLQSAIDRGFQNQDHELVVEASTDLMVVLNYQGNVIDSLRVADLISQTSRKLPKNYARRFESYRAITMLHAGRGREGLALFDRSSESANLSPIEVATSFALKSLFLSSAGKRREAEAANAYPVSIAKSTGHFEVRIVSQLASALIKSKDDPHGALGELESVAQNFKGSGPTRLSLCASEQVAVIHAELGNQSDAGQLIASINQTRAKFGYARTSWDRLRLKPLLLRLPSMA